MLRFVLPGTALFLLLAPVAVAVGASVSDYGAIPDDGLDDTAAFQAAVRGGGIVYVPAGTFQVSVGGRPSLFAVTCPKSVQLVGNGRDQTRIVTEETLTATGNAFLFESGTQAAFQDLTIQGPKVLNGFYSVGIIHHGGAGGSLRIERCAIRGGHMAVRMEELNGKQEWPRTTILDSLLESPTCLHVLNSGQCSVTRTEFRGYGTPGSNQAHAIYTYLPVSLVVDRCTFVGNLGYGYDVHPYSPTVPGRGSVWIRDSSFPGIGTGQGILTHPVAQTKIDGCHLGATRVNVQRGGAVLSGCALWSQTQVVAWPFNPGTWTFRDCTFGE